MKFAIIGAGGIGCYYGARLVSAGHDVTFVARGSHLKAMQEGNLLIVHDDFSFNERVSAVNIETLISEFDCTDYDLLILATKSAATEDIMNQLEGWMSGCSTPMLSIQNGVNNEAKIASVIGKERTIGGLAVRIGGHIVAPGEVHVNGISEIEMGGWPNHHISPDLAESVFYFGKVFNDSGIPTRIYDDVEHALWKKLVINNSVNPLSALTGLDTKRLTSDKRLRKVVLQLMKETGKAANYAGVNITAEDVNAMFELISNFAAIKTSMLVDREKGRPLEIEDICGPVICHHEKNGDTAEMTSLIKTLLEANMAFVPSV